MAPTSKIQDYFASMNPLSARISSDIRAIEENMLKEGGGDDDEGSHATVKLTYNEKCAAIDKYLIDDVIEKNTKSRLAPGGGLVPKISRRPKLGSADHLLALIQAMQPPKPEKYVFEEAGGVWLDEHSGPFSFCKQSQVKHCALGKNVLQNLAEAEPMEIVRRHPSSSKNAEKKRQKPDMKNKVPQQQQQEPQNQNKRNSQEIVEIQPQRAAAGRGIYGVNVMDFMGTGNGQIKSTKLSAIKPHEKRDDAEEEELRNEMEDKLPQQKQNLQLIAELQAKLKRNNPTEESNANANAGAEQKEPEECQQEPEHQPVKKDASGTKQAKSKGKKLKKPKAPPPPPPRAAPKIESTSSSATRESTDAEGKTSTFGKHQKAVADQLRNVIAGVKLLTHSRKNSNPPAPTPRAEPAEIVKEVPTPTPTEPMPSTSKAALQKQAPRPIPRSRSKTDDKEGSNSKPTANKGKAEGGPEFCVDVSSPCKIATPKTGLDFLDNW